MADFGSGASVSGDQAAREIIRHSLQESLLVEASAGTGKTSELTRRIVNLLKSGAGKVENIVAVTFTNKAAGELKIRLRQGLDDARATAESAEETKNLEESLSHLEEAFIGTIHAFCAQILRERPVEAHVDPAFEEITETESARIFEEAFHKWFQERLAHESPGLRRALARLAWPDPWDRMPPIEQLKLTGRKLLDWRDFPAPWRREMFARRQKIDELLAKIEEVAAIGRRARNPQDLFVQTLKPMNEFRARTYQHEGGPTDYDTLEALLGKLNRDMLSDSRKGSGHYGDGITRDEAVLARDQLRQMLRDFQIRSDADLASILKEEMVDLIAGYERLKKKSGKLDFLDLLLFVRNLVRDNAEVRCYLQNRYTHLFVDEFQDTDPVQAETLLLLSANDPAEADWRNVTPVPGKFFAVGDPKQSIYKFRRADVLLYRGIQEQLMSRGVRHVQLTVSFRSTRPIQQFVNAAFRPAMTGDQLSGQAVYSDLEEHWPAYEQQPSVIALPVPRPYGARNITKEKVNVSLPPAVGGFIEWLLRRSGWTVRDPEGGNDLIPIAARHICILFRRFVNLGADVTRPYVKALEAHEIPHLLVGSRSFHKREEVETLRAALTAVEWPDDELSVFATLKGSLFAIEDALLLRYRLEVGKLQPFVDPPKDLALEFYPIRDALQLLRDLHKRRNWKPVADSVHALLEFTRAHAGFALRPAGQQVLANVYRVADLARNFEITGGISFRGFVEELNRQAERSDASEAPVLEYASDGVRLMTVHTAKGLEFPIVILADMRANLSAKEPDRFIDNNLGLCATRLLRCSPWELRENEYDELERERAEGVRVAYVAATRARDLLVIPAVGDLQQEGWLSPLNRALFPPVDDWREATPARGCPQFRGNETVLDRPDPNEDGKSVRPGLHKALDGDHEVVWWDPLELNLETDTQYGLQQEDLLVEHEPASTAGLEEYQHWQQERARILSRGGHASQRLLLASEAEEADPPEFAAALRLRTDSVSPHALDRPGGRKFGVLVHSILRDAALDGSDLERWVDVHGTLQDSDLAERETALDVVRSALQHSLFDRARKAARVEREFPVTLRLEDGKILEGVIDLAFQEQAGEWVIVDFKTANDDPSVYERQLRWYAHALARIEGAAVSEAWILGV
jgi:ATP-dependent helicase/nuclease subunit A